MTITMVSAALIKIKIREYKRAIENLIFLMSKLEIFKIGVKRIQKDFLSTSTIKKIISIQLHYKKF